MIQRKSLFIRLKGTTYDEYIIIIDIYAIRDTGSNSKKTVIIAPARRNRF